MVYPNRSFVGCEVHECDGVDGRWAQSLVAVGDQLPQGQRVNIGGRRLIPLHEEPKTLQDEDQDLDLVLRKRVVLHINVMYRLTVKIAHNLCISVVIKRKSIV